MHTNEVIQQSARAALGKGGGASKTVQCAARSCSFHPIYSGTKYTLRQAGNCKLAGWTEDFIWSWKPGTWIHWPNIIHHKSLLYNKLTNKIWWESGQTNTWYITMICKTVLTKLPVREGADCPMWELRILTRLLGWISYEPALVRPCYPVNTLFCNSLLPKFAGNCNSLLS